MASSEAMASSLRRASAEVVRVDVDVVGQPGGVQSGRHGGVPSIRAEAQLAGAEGHLVAHPAREDLAIGVLEAHRHARREVRHAPSGDV